MAKKMNAAQRAQAALRREAHVRTVYERADDPRYVQQCRIDDETVEMTLTPELSEMFRGQLEAFKEKFGRDPLPDDPLFFDPDQDTPQPLSDKTRAQIEADMLKAAVAVGIDPAFIHAGQEVGYTVTEANKHLFTAYEVEVYTDAVERHRQAASATSRR